MKDFRLNGNKIILEDYGSDVKLFYFCLVEMVKLNELFSFMSLVLDFIKVWGIYVCKVYYKLV